MMWHFIKCTDLLDDYECKAKQKRCNIIDLCVTIVIIYQSV